MKKLLSFCLAMGMLFSASVSASAAEVEGITLSDSRRCDSRFIQKFDYTLPDGTPVSLDEATLIQMHRQFDYQAVADAALDEKIRNEYADYLSYSSITANDLSLKYYGSLGDGTMVLRIESPFGYTADMGYISMNGYMYIRNSGQEYTLYKDGKFSYIYDAYESGALGGGLLDELAEILTFAVTGDSHIIVGDVNLDNRLSISDVTCIQQSIAEYDYNSDVSRRIADVDGDGKVGIRDATILQKQLVGITE